MKKKVSILILAIAIAQLIYYAYPRANAAIPVIDTANIAETHATYLQAYMTALNTATQIANQVLELTTMSPESLASNMLGVNNQLGEISAVMHSAQGLMHAAQNTEQAWKRAFNGIENYGTNSISDRFAQQQNMVTVLDQTYQDSLRVAKISSQLESDAKNLDAMLHESQNATGNKHLGQALAAISAQGVKQEIQSNQILANIATTLAAQANYQRSIDNASLIDAQKTVQGIDSKISNNSPLSERRKGWL